MNHNNANMSCFSSNKSNNNESSTMKGGTTSTDKNPPLQLDHLDPRVQVPVALNHQILSNIPIESLSKFTIAQQNAILASFSSKLESIPNSHVNNFNTSSSLDENDPKVVTTGSSSPMLIPQQQPQQPYRQKCLFLQAVQEMEKTLPTTSTTTMNTTTTSNTTSSSNSFFVPPEFCLNGEALRQYTLLPTRELQDTASQYCVQAAHWEWTHHGRVIKQPHAFYNHHFFLWLSSSGVVTALTNSIPDFELPEASQVVFDTQLSPTQQKSAQTWCCTEAKKCRNAIRNPPSYYHKLFVKYLLSASSTPQEQLLGLELSEKGFGGSSAMSSSAMSSLGTSPLTQAKPKSLSTRSSSSSSTPPSPSSHSPTIQLASTTNTTDHSDNTATAVTASACRCLASTLLAIEKETTKTLLEKLRAAEKVTHEAHQRIRALQQELASQRIEHEAARREWMNCASASTVMQQLQPTMTTMTAPGLNHSPPPPSHTSTPPPPPSPTPPTTTNNSTTLEPSVSNMTAAVAVVAPTLPVGSTGHGDDQSIESLLTLSPLDLGTTTRSGEFHWPPPPPTKTLTTSSPTSVMSAAAAAARTTTPATTNNNDPFAWFPTNDDNWAGSSNPSLNGSFSSLTMIHQPTNNINDSETFHHAPPPGLVVGVTKHANDANASVMDSLYFLSSPRDVFHVLSGPPGLPRLFPLDDTVVDDDDHHAALLTATTATAANSL
jgi:hypothetical protein